MKQLTMSVLISSVLASATSFADLEPPSGPTLSPGEEYSWVHQFGSNNRDSANSIATFGASVYVVGAVEIDNSGPPFGGNGNGFLQRYDLWGNLVSELPFGEPQQSEANAVFGEI